MLCDLRFGSIFHYDMKLFRQRFLGENDDVAGLNYWVGGLGVMMICVSTMVVFINTMINLWVLFAFLGHTQVLGPLSEH